MLIFHNINSKVLELLQTEYLVSLIMGNVLRLTQHRFRVNIGPECSLMGLGTLCTTCVFLSPSL